MIINHIYMNDHERIVHRENRIMLQGLRICMCLTMTMAGHWTMVNGDDAIEDDNTGDDIIMTLVVTIHSQGEFAHAWLHQRPESA